MQAISSTDQQEKQTPPSKRADGDVVEMAKTIVKKDRRIAELEQRVTRIEKRTKSNEQFARTLAACLSTQVIGVDAVTSIVRRAIVTDAEIHDELSSAIQAYDKRKIRRWFSGFLGVLLWLASVAAAAVIGALIHWLFAGD